MIARIATIFPTDATLFREIIRRPASLAYVSAPLLYFQLLEDGEDEDWLAEEWVVGREYALQLFLWRWIPLGRHWITLVEVDLAANTIRSHERGTLAPVWKHTIQFMPVGENQLYYSDEIEIQAGPVTPLVWLFAHIFYRHRQRRWRKLLEMNTSR